MSGETRVRPTKQLAICRDRPKIHGVRSGCLANKTHSSSQLLPLLYFLNQGDHLVSPEQSKVPGCVLLGCSVTRPNNWFSEGNRGLFQISSSRQLVAGKATFQLGTIVPRYDQLL